MGAGEPSLEAELVRVADDSMGVHREGVEHHGGVDEVLLNALQAGVQLLKPHYLGGAYKRRQDCGPSAFRSHRRAGSGALLEGSGGQIGGRLCPRGQTDQGTWLSMGLEALRQLK